ncbi:TIR domain-containing protein [Variovorax sp. J22R115]|uniref:nSTAND1 domain-containing NTPase n=1 Tax=Variovorax sp. J22R115 TaxID=3053509 RepID=UPI00257541DE|nr:TIR domain-containing protein [Variovorax sp. J22R115]MDM0053752.1 TIR domain-containing protein [Variovorax sp. J22R115]
MKSNYGDKLVLFLSHSGADSDAALRLASRLEDTPALRDRGLTIWIDKRHLVPGRDWQMQLEVAIQDAHGFLIYIGSRGTVNWVEREVRLALSRAASDPGYLFIPIVSSECGTFEEAHLPAFAGLYHAARQVESDPIEFTKLVRALLGDHDSLQAVRLVETPYIGLRSFDMAHAHLFFGREKEIVRVLEELRHGSLLMVAGDSGSGKSSLIKAGVIPRFLGGALEDHARDLPDERAWVCIEMRPGSPSRDPFENLAHAVYKTARATGASHSDGDSMRNLVRSQDVFRIGDALRDAVPSNASILLYVDQFEELLTLCPTERRTPFLDVICAMASEGDPALAKVLMSMRWDYYNLCSQYPTFFKAIEQAKHPIAPMERGQLIRCIVEPLKLAGQDAAIAQRFGERVLHDVSGEPRDLALLQMAMKQTWRGLRDHGGDLHAAYEAAGLVSGALAKEAERVYEKVLNDHERREVEPLLLRLVRLGDTGGVTRRVVVAEDLSGAALAVARKLATEEGGRLLQVRARPEEERVNNGEVEPRVTVELSHEKLATQWPRYQGWLQDAAHDKRIHDALVSRSRRWEDAPARERSKHLLTGADLEQCGALAGSRPTWLSESERAFVEESRAAHEWQIRREQKSTLLIRLWSWLSVVLAVGAVGFAVWAFNSSQEAAERLADLAWTNAVMHRDLLHHPLHARHYAAEVAARTRDTVRAQNAAYAAQFSTFLPYRLVAVLGHGASIGARFDKDGARVLTWSDDGTARVWEAATGKALGEPMKHAKEVSGATFDKGGARVLTWSDAEARVWDAATGRALGESMKHAKEVSNADFDKGGARVLTWSSWDGTARVWEAATGRALSDPMKHAGGVAGATFDKDGAQVLTRASSEARVWNADTGKALGEPMKHAGAVRGAIFDKDGARVLTWSDDETARVWKAATGKAQGEPMKHARAVRGAIFDKDGARVLTWSYDGTARVWETATGKALGKPMEHAREVSGAIFDKDSARVLTWSRDGTARVWEAATGKALGEPMKHAKEVSGAIFDKDSARVLTWSQDGTARVWEAATGKALGEPMEHASEVWGAIFDKDSARVLTWSQDGTARVWEAATGKALSDPMKHAKLVWKAEFDKDGLRVLTWSDDGTARVWEAANFEPMKHAKAVLGAEFDKDGARVLTWSKDGTARVWETATGKALGEPMEHAEGVSGAIFDKNGARVLTWSDDGTAKVWEAATGKALGEPMKHAKEVSGATFDKDGARVLTWSQSDGTARMWEAATGKALGEPMGHPGGVFGADFDKDGTRVLTWSQYGNTTRVWNAATGKALSEPIEHAFALAGATFDKDGARVLTWAYNEARVWNADTGKALGKPMRHAAELVRGATFDKDGARVLTWGDDKTARVWDAATGKALGEPIEHTKEMSGAIFDKGGARVLTWSLSEGTAQMWDAATGKALGEPMKHAGEVWGADFDTDGARVLTLGDDETARVWEAATGRALGEPIQHAGVSGAIFDNNGARVLTWSEDGTARVWGRGVKLGFPRKLLPLRVQVESGTRLTSTGELETISATEWRRLRHGYEEQARQ